MLLYFVTIAAKGAVIAALALARVDPVIVLAILFGAAIAAWDAFA